jgi:hypothetical protein
MAFPPEVFLIGAMKAGTTSFASHLADHPRICLAKPKEPAYFTRNWALGPDWYRARFDSSEDSLFLDATTAYSAAPTDLFPSDDGTPGAFRGVPERIHSVNPQTRVIYILRDPVMRAYSAYWHVVRQGQETRSFRDVVTEDLSYLRPSDYYGQVKNYLDFFPLSSFFFLQFEHVIRDIPAAAKQCFESLGLTPLPRRSDSPSKSLHKNQSFQYNWIGSVIFPLLPKGGSFDRFSNLIRAHVPEGARTAVRRVITKPIPRLSKEDQRYLADVFRDRNIALRELTGLPLAEWHE